MSPLPTSKGRKIMSEPVTTRRSNWRFLPKLQFTGRSQLQRARPKRSVRSVLMLGRKTENVIGNERKSQDSLSANFQSEKSQIGNGADRDASREVVDDEGLEGTLDLLEYNEGK